MSITWFARRSLSAAWLNALACLMFTLFAFGPTQHSEAEQPPRLGDPFVVNVYTTGYQAGGELSVNEDGSFVVVWFSASLGDQDTDSSIQGRRFDADGNGIGDQFLVNNYTTGFQFNPAIAAAPNGDFVVTWASAGSPGNDDSGDSIQLRRFQSDGTPLADQIQVNTVTSGNASRPRVAMSSQGDFIVVWANPASVGDDTDDSSIQAQRFDSSGALMEAQFQVNTITTDQQGSPAVAVNGNGEFLVTWENDVFENGQFRRNIQGQLFRSDGSRLGQQIPLSSDDPGSRDEVDVAVDPNGDFTVVWSDDPTLNGPLRDSIEARRVFSNGSFSGAPVSLIELSNTSKFRPRIEHDAQGGFVVVWARGEVYSSQFLRRFGADLEPLGDAFQISPENEYPINSAIGVDADDNFMVVWDGKPLSATGEDFGVFGQRFCGTDCLLFDGFESGDTSAWSTTMGQ